jgi:hypothetical protein
VERTGDEVAFYCSARLSDSSVWRFNLPGGAQHNAALLQKMARAESHI